MNIRTKTMGRLFPALLLTFAALSATVPSAHAQGRDVDVFFDERGRRILLDRDTGEVVGVEPPRRVFRDPEAIPDQRIIRRDFGRGEVVGGPYDMSDPADRERFRRDREILLGRREAPTRPDLVDRRYEEPVYGEPEDRVFPPLPEDDGIRRLPEYAYPDPDEALPEAAPDEPGVVRRAPLGTRPGATASIVEPNDPLAEPTDATLTPRESGPGIGEGVAPQMPKGASEDIAIIQILLDRAGASPGVIDGRMGDNVNKAISAYKEIHGSALRTYDKTSIEAALTATGGPAFVDYTITPTDAAGPYVASVPADYGEKARLDRLSYTSVSEMLAERFHMDEKYLKALNPGVSFNRPGVIIKVANVGAALSGAVERIVADKPNKQVRAYGAGGRLIAVYPSTIGSGDTPSPSGTHTVERIAFDPEYTYNPKLNFKQGANDKVLTIPPGPNGPVGSIWIALSKPTYGIHGTPDPSKIGKTESHGCVRLTNWDATELAKMVKKGVTVEFVD